MHFLFHMTLNILPTSLKSIVHHCFPKARLISFFLCCLAVLTLFAPAESWSQTKKRVLILHSYNQGNKWTDDENKGILEIMGATRPGFQIEIEYMDTKKIADDYYFRQLFDIYTRKYKKIHFDVIISTDDNAFFFLLNYRDILFSGSPVVFCGVNFFKPSYLSKVKGFTGVNEDADLKGAIDTALALHPKTREMVLITDATETGQRISEYFKELIPLYHNKIAFSILDDMEMGQVQDIVSNLKPGALVLFTFFFRDQKGLFFDYYESNELITGKAKVPVYVAWDYSMGHAVGGLMVSGIDQGRVAGNIAHRILKGESADSIPVVMESPNRHIFDYNQMTRFNIKPSDLPQGSTIINEPSSLYAINKYTVWSVLGGFLVLSGLVIFLQVNMNKTKKAKAAYLASEKNYHTLVSNLRIGIYRSSKDLCHGNFLEANPAMVSLFGFDTHKEFLAVPIVSLYQNPEDRKVFLDELFKKGFVKDREIAMKKKDGTPITVSCTTTLQYDDNGGIQWLDGVMEDISLQKNLENQLRQAQKMEAIGTLAGGVAHDFNNILTVIMGYTEIIKLMTEEDDSRWEYFNHILDCSEKAASLIKGLLAFSRKQIISTKPVELKLIIQNVESILRSTLGEDIELVTHFVDEPLTILADSNQIEHVLMNLATNARDAMPSGGMLSISTKRVEVTVENLSSCDVSDPGIYALISVSDTGEGMNMVTQQKIFEPFFTTKAMGRGTGLGLSMIYGTIKQHNGEIKVYSELGKGTTFKIYLPLFSGKTETLDASFRETQQLQKGFETILVAEDNQDVRELVVDTLTKSGYRVIQAVDGEDAVRQFIKYAKEIDLILLDVVMPKLNGKEAVEKITDLHPGVKVLYMSGYTADVIHKKGILDEQVNFIFKPLSLTVLLKKIREIIDG
ncbi:MAG: ATP-binding protein [Pseudomonadota bacterium]